MNTQTLSSDFFQPDGVNLLGFANRMEPGTDVWGFKNKLAPSAQNFQMDRSYNIAGGKKFYVGRQRDALSFFATVGHSVDYRYTDEIIRNTNTGGTIYKDLNGHKSTTNISQLALANVDYDMHNRHHLSYNFMMVHSNVQSKGKTLLSVMITVIWE